MLTTYGEPVSFITSRCKHGAGRFTIRFHCNNQLLHTRELRDVADARVKINSNATPVKVVVEIEKVQFNRWRESWKGRARSEVQHTVHVLVAQCRAHCVNAF